MLGLLLSISAALAETAGGSLVLARRAAVGRGLRLGQAVGAGFILALSLAGLIPEAQDNGGSTMFTVLGFLVILLVDAALGHHGEAHGHVHAEEPATVGEAQEAAPEPSAVRAAHTSTAAGAEARGDEHAKGEARLRRAAIASWAGVAVCAFSDGVSLASAGAAGAAVGFFVFLGYMPHKFVEGFSISTVLSGAGVRRARAAAAAALLGLSTILGGTLTLFALARWVSLGHALAFSSGIMLNLAASELIPHLRENGDRRLLYLVPLGTALYFATTALVRLSGLEP
ncbi:MAG: ZIP family metal transporter [Firmicutes bacterium]|nr:ZIP family metal transporter [Bacillota bacterium]